MSFRILLQNYFSAHQRGWVLSLLLAVGIVYFPFLGNPFIFDDQNFFLTQARDYYRHSISLFDLRWLPNASISYTYALFTDVDTYAYHLGNALLHGANVILLFYLLRQWLGSMTGEHTEAAISRMAWFGALVFAVHPVAVYAVGYMVERSILMATLFALVMQLAYLRGLLSGQRRWFVLAVLAYFLACFSKEHSVLMPAVLAAMGWLVRGKSRAEKKVLWLTWTAFIAIAILVTLRAKGVLGSAYEPMAAAIFEQQKIVASVPMLHLLSALTQAGLFFKYLALWLLPNVGWMSVDMREQFVTSADWGSWMGMLAFAGYGAAAVWLLLKGGVKGWAGFALLYPWLQFWVELTGIRVQEPFVLYRSYLWLPGMMLFVPLLLMRLPGRKTLWVLGGVVLLLLPLAWNRLWVFSNNYRLWAEAAALLPNKEVAGADRIYYNRAYYGAQEHRWEQAIPDYEFVVSIDPGFAVVHNDLGVAYLNVRRNQDALAQFDAAIALSPTFAQAYFNKGLALKFENRGEEALQQMELSCKLKNVSACLIVSMNKRGKN